MRCVLFGGLLAIVVLGPSGCGNPSTTGQAARPAPPGRIRNAEQEKAEHPEATAPARVKFRGGARNTARSLRSGTRSP
jgi:hypothetical protein